MIVLARCSRSRLGALVMSLGMLACVDDTKGSAADQASRLGSFILDAPPVMPHSSDIVFDGKVRLLGYKIVPDGAAAPNADVKLSLYWQVDAPLEPGWLLFTHLVDARGVRVANLDGAGPLRTGPNGQQSLPPGAWQKGKVYVDELSFRLPADASGDLTVAVGIWRGENRLAITRGKADGEKRALLVKIPTSGAAAGKSSPSDPSGASGPPARLGVPSLQALKLEDTEAPVIDGKLDDPAWKFAVPTGDLVDVSNGQKNSAFPVNASAKITWDDRALYLAFDVKDDNILGGFKPDAIDPHLWERSCVEIMVDPDGDGDNRDYYEIQISPQNLVFDSQFDSYNLPKGGPDGPFGHQEWSIQGQTAVVVNGTIEKSDDKDTGYTVEASIPWTSFSKAKASPPKPGDTWRMNFYAMRTNGGVAWSPILGQGNFHKAARFGRVAFHTRSSALAATTAAGRPQPEGPIPAPDTIPSVIYPQPALDEFGPPPPPINTPPRETVKPMPGPRRNNNSSGFLKPQ